MALITLMANVWGGTWFDMKWQPQLTSEPWKKAVNFYVDLMTKYGPPGATSNGFNENQALFASGHCAIWVDATSAAGRLYNKETSKVADVIGYAKAPGEVTNIGAGWFWAWALAIPSTTTKAEAAKSFVKWATSKEYVKLVAKTRAALLPRPRAPARRPTPTSTRKRLPSPKRRSTRSSRPILSKPTTRPRSLYRHLVRDHS